MTPEQRMVEVHRLAMDDPSYLGNVETRRAYSAAGAVAIRAAAEEEREACARISELTVEYQMPVSCPDGKIGCAVFHSITYRRPRTHEEIAAAIRGRKEER